MKSPYRLDKDKIVVNESDSVLAVIPMSARNMVLSLCEFINWKAFWSVNPPDDAEWDEIQFIISELEQAMSTSISVQMLDDRLTDIEQAILTSSGGGGGVDPECCEAIVHAIMGIGLSGVLADMPEEQPGDNPHEDEVSHAELEETVSVSNDTCGYMYLAVDGMKDTMYGLAPIVKYGWVAMLFAIPILLLAAWWGLVAVPFALTGVTAISIWSSLMSFTESELKSAGDYLSYNRDGVVCEALDYTGGMTEANYAVDIKLMMDGLKFAYPAGPAKVLATFLYTNGLAKKHATMEWESAICPECLPGCSGLGWSFATPFPSDCWSVVSGATTDKTGTSRAVFPSDSVRTVSLDLPLSSVSTRSLKVRFIPLSSSFDSCGIETTLRRVPVGGGSGTTVESSVHWGSVGSGISELVTAWEHEFDANQYTYQLWLRWRSIGGNRATTLVSASLI